MVKFIQSRPNGRNNYKSDTYNYNPYTDKLPTETNWKYIKYSLKNNDINTSFEHILIKDEIIDNNFWILCAGPGGTGGGHDTNKGGGGGGGSGEVTMHVVNKNTVENNMLKLTIGKRNSKTRTEDTDDKYNSSSSTYVKYNTTTGEEPILKATGGFQGSKATTEEGAMGGSGGGYRNGTDYEEKEKFNTADEPTIKFGSAGGGGGYGVHSNNGDIGNQTKLFKTTGSEYVYKYLDRTLNKRTGDSVSVDFDILLRGNQCDNTGTANVLKAGDGGRAKENGQDGPGGFIMIFYITNSPITSNDIKKYKQEFQPFLNIYNYNPFTEFVPGQVSQGTNSENWIYYKYTNTKSQNITFTHQLTDVDGPVWILCVGPGGTGGGHDTNKGGGGGGGSGEVTMQCLDGTVYNDTLSCYIGDNNNKLRTENSDKYIKEASSLVFYNKIISKTTATTTDTITVTIETQGNSRESFTEYPNPTVESTGWIDDFRNITEVNNDLPRATYNIHTTTKTYVYQSADTSSNLENGGPNDNIPKTKWTLTINKVKEQYEFQPNFAKATGGFKGIKATTEEGAMGGSGGGYRIAIDGDIKETFNTATATATEPTIKFGSAGGGGGYGVHSNNGDIGNQTKLFKTTGSEYVYKYLDRQLNQRTGDSVSVDFDILLRGNQCDNTGTANVLKAGDGGRANENGQDGPKGYIMIFHKTTVPLTKNITPPIQFHFGYSPISNTILNEPGLSFYQQMLYYTDDTTSSKTISKNMYNTLFNSIGVLLVGGGGGGGNTWWDGYDSYGGGGGGSGGYKLFTADDVAEKDLVIKVGETGKTHDTPLLGEIGSDGEDGKDTTIVFNNTTHKANGGEGGKKAKDSVKGDEAKGIPKWDGGSGGVNGGVNGGDGQGHKNYVGIGAHATLVSVDTNGNLINLNPSVVGIVNPITWSGNGGPRRKNREYETNKNLSSAQDKDTELDVDMPRYNGGQAGKGYVVLYGSLKASKF